jgi:SAM-dependent methyltransferase
VRLAWRESCKGAGVLEIQLRLASVRRSLAIGTLGDAAFDELLPEPMRKRSPRHWTPLAVARRAAALFRARGVRSVLDVGCGPGKFCLAAAAAEETLEFQGIDRRPTRVNTANELAAKLGCANARFACGDVFEVDWAPFEGLYFFNPFEEDMTSEEGASERRVGRSVADFLSALRAFSSAFAALRPGTIVITYHGLGMPIPSSYQLVTCEPAGTDFLRVWRRTGADDQGWYYLETGEGVCRVSERMLRGSEARIRGRSSE